MEKMQSEMPSWMLGEHAEKLGAKSAFATVSLDTKALAAPRRPQPQGRSTYKQVGKQAGICLRSCAQSAADIILAKTDDTEARRRIVEMVEKRVLGDEESGEKRLGTAVLGQLKGFREWVLKQQVGSSDRQPALIATQVATLPPASARLDDSYKACTGFDKRGYDDIRRRRERPAEYATTEKGVYCKTHKARGRRLTVEEQRFAVGFWKQTTAPRASGAGEYNKVRPSPPPKPFLEHSDPLTLPHT